MCFQNGVVTVIFLDSVGVTVIFLDTVGVTVIFFDCKNFIPIFRMIHSKGTVLLKDHDNILWNDVSDVFGGTRDGEFDILHFREP